MNDEVLTARKIESIIRFSELAGIDPKPLRDFVNSRPKATWEKIVKASLGDLFEGTSHLSPKHYDTINTTLLEEGLLGIPDLRLLERGGLEGLLKKKRISNETDAILLKNALVDGRLNQDQAAIAKVLLSKWDM